MSTKQAFVRAVAIVGVLLGALTAVGCSGGTSGSPGADGGRADSATEADSAGLGVDSAPGLDSMVASDGRGDSTGAADSTAADSTVGDSSLADSGAVVDDGHVEAAGDAAGAGDTSSTTDGGASDSSAVDSSEAGLAADASGVLATISLSGQPTAMQIDNTRNRLYVALADALGDNLGFAIVDTATNTVTATIPAPAVDSGTGPGPFFALALDPTANLLYASDLNATPLVYVFDVTASTFKNRFSVVGSGIAVPWISSLVVNPATSTLYVGALDTAGGAAKVAVINTTNDTLTTEITLADLGLGSGVSSLALDTTNNLLFVAAAGPGNGPPATAVDTIDTTTDLERGTQQELTGSDLGCLGAPGAAVDVTVSRGVTDGGVAGYFYSLEPYTVPLPPGFIPDSYAPDTADPSANYVTVYGHSGSTGAGEFVVVSYPKVEGLGPPTTQGPDPTGYNGKVTGVGVKSSTEFYLTLDIVSNGGTSPENAVFDFQIPAPGP